MFVKRVCGTNTIDVVGGLKEWYVVTLRALFIKRSPNIPSPSTIDEPGYALSDGLFVCDGCHVSAYFFDRGLFSILSGLARVTRIV